MVSWRREEHAMQEPPRQPTATDLLDNLLQAQVAANRILQKSLQHQQVMIEGWLRWIWYTILLAIVLSGLAVIVSSGSH